ncbi:nuclear transport factor 2 family protein [Ruania suaedae]|uniref:nuclear transport factor 2 family protein n=1 Tax=Ruania suaedae TaxID=2897774 RepID=UPI001E2F3018|nr:nuclear transport factor 2 family protein [Ruania suaedae]UFU01692.1 nuclear transport factor 2 family protein [Ruania suaedae]
MSGNATTVHDFAERYLAAATDPDPDPEQYVALFADDAVVRDEGREHHGPAQVRAWRTQAPAVRYVLHEVSGGPEAPTVTAEISGEFPGSPVVLQFAFRRDPQGQITELEIAP